MRLPHVLARRTASIATTVLGGALIASTALATGASAVSSSAPALASADADDTGRMMLVLDSSGSMKEKAGDGATKIEAARTALESVVDKLSDSQDVGMRVFGATVFSRNDKGACTDTQKVVDPGTDNRDALRAAISAYKPYGETPIGTALLEAARDLGDEGRRSIVLVSDGESTCAPDPCKVAARISKQGIDLTVDVVGLSVDAKTRKQLRCIAEAGNGRYYDAEDAGELSGALDTAAVRAARPWTAIGTPITGGPDAANATTITTGDWRDALGPQHTVPGQRWFRFTRTIPGSTVRVSAAIAGPTGGYEVDDGLYVETFVGSEDCGTGADSQAGTGYQPILVATEAVPGNRDYNDECKDGSEITFNVTRGKQSGDVSRRTEELVEIRIIEEPPAANAASLPASAPKASEDVPSMSDPTPLPTGGVSFGDAAPLDPGAFRGSIVPGETQIFRIDLDWGQSLSSVIQFDPITDTQKQALGDVDLNTTLWTFSPGRAIARAPFVSDSQGRLTDFSSPELAAVTPVVTYNERRSTADGNAAASIAGPYYLVLGVAGENGGTVEGAAAGVELGFTLGLARNGERKGVPEYDGEAPQFGGETSETVDPGDDDSGEADASDTSASSATDSDDGAGWLPFALAGAGAVLVLGGVAALLVVRRRRRQSAEQAPPAYQPWDGSGGASPYQ
ncbi:VWA domain-containing protein [Mumia sp. zg.B53]|uniref:vWA domain-containing protein n=1 Tax=Mumia sp. zg.B53 TaxID=2855449 RepID=UPI001C6E2400|nr:VWA domain-containing protein [Mumia sp. zg.B53]MBW9213760.1 VWA domain-containing protein [Mumia sp. zg.B53]